jgi:very-short-patch-repair endonuclease
MIASAHDRRAKHLADPTAAEIAFNDVLIGLGFIEDHDYERESIWFYPGSYALFDFFFKSHMLVFEIDGSAHDDLGQKNHDETRDQYFARQGIKTVRIKNRVVLSRPDVCRSLVMVELACR